MGKRKTEKGRVIDDAFRREAVRILTTSGRTIKSVADDLGIGVSSLGAWKRKLDRADLMAGPHEDVEKELARLRRENELLRAERDLLKNRRGPLPACVRKKQPVLRFHGWRAAAARLLAVLTP